MELDPRMTTMAAAGLYQEKLKKQSLAILEITNLVLQSTVIRDSGHLDIFTSRLNALNDSTRGGSRVINRSDIDTLKQQIIGYTKGQALAECHCVTCAAKHAAEQQRAQQKLEADRRAAESRAQAQEARARELLEAKEATRLERESKRAEVRKSWRRSPYAGLVVCFTATGATLGVQVLNDRVTVAEALTMPNYLVVGLLAWMNLLAGYRAGGGLAFGATMVSPVGAYLFIGLKRLWVPAGTLTDWFTPHVVTDAGSLLQSSVWILFACFCARAIYSTPVPSKPAS